MALQLTAQNGDDGGDLGQGQARFIEEEYEFGYQLCLVGYFSIPGSFPGEPGREAVKALAGMNQILSVSAKKVFQARLVPWPSDSWQLVKMLEDAHQVCVCQVSELLEQVLIVPSHPGKPPLKTAPITDLNSEPQGELMSASENPEQRQQTHM